MANYEIRQSDSVKAIAGSEPGAQQEQPKNRILHVPWPEGVMRKVPFEKAEFRHMVAEAIEKGHHYHKVVIVKLAEDGEITAKRVVKENGFSCQPYDEPV